LGGLIDWATLGSADYHMAAALVGNVGMSLNRYFPRGYREMCEQWAGARRAPCSSKSVRRSRPYARPHSAPLPRLDAKPGVQSALEAIAAHRLDPNLDLKRDWQGLWQLTERNRELRDGLRAYARLRDEDSPDIRGMI